MTTLNIGGKRVTVSDNFKSLSPDEQQATVDEIAKNMGIGAEQPASMRDTLVDVGMGAAQGFQTGLQSIAGAIGDTQQMASDATGWLANKLGASPETQEMASGMARKIGLPGMGLGVQMPTTQTVNRAVESVIGPKFEAQTTPGQFAQTIGEFAPAAAAGPGGVMRKAAMAVIPGAAVETADIATDGNPYAMAAAGIGAGVLSAGRGNQGTKDMLKAVGKSDKAYARVEKQANEAYTRLRNAGIKYDANGVDQAINDISQLRINPQLSPDAAGLRDTVSRFMGRGMDFQDLDELEQLATGILRHHATKPADKFFTTAILGKLRDIRNGALVTNGSVPAGDVNRLVAQAKDLGRRRIIARDIGKMKDKAEWYLSGPESGLRNQFRNYGQRNYQNLSPMEEQAFQSVVAREGPLNVAHNAGSRLGQIALGSMGYAVGDITGAIVPIIGSSLARRFMEAYTRKGVDDAIKTVLAGRPAQEQAAVRDAVSRMEAAARASVAADTSIRTSSGAGLPAIPR